MMEQFEWNANYATGIREIDSQHAYLFALTNRLIRQQSGDAVGNVTIASILDELNDYVDRHFSYEESVLEQVGYEHLEEHKVLHERMRQRLQLYASELKSGRLTVAEVTNFLKSWLRLHILREDIKYTPAVSHLRDGG